MSSESSIWGLDLMVHSINKNIKKLRIYSDQNKQQTNEKKNILWCFQSTDIQIFCLAPSFTDWDCSVQNFVVHVSNANGFVLVLIQIVDEANPRKCFRKINTNERQSRDNLTKCTP